MPSFVGQTLTDANAEAARLKLTSAVVDHTTSDRYPKNVVISQRPDAGAQAREGRQVSFVISDGIVARLMPDLRYQSMREVELDLSRVRMKLGKVTYAKSDIVPEGHVISQDPAPLADVGGDDTVTLVVSRGGLSALQVPNFTGMLVDDARALAEKSGVKLGQIVWTPLGPNGPPHGAVVRQIPARQGEDRFVRAGFAAGQRRTVRIGLRHSPGAHARLGAGSRSSTAERSADRPATQQLDVRLDGDRRDR